MQYILSQQEYEFLTHEKRLRTEKQHAELLELCRLAARHIPVTLPWRTERAAEPWGCILISQEPELNPGYCDHCPARNVCPYEHKEWSE